MACTLTKGRIEPCKDKIGGIYKVFFANYGTLTDLTYNLTDDSVSGVIDAQLFEYQLKGTSTLAQSMVSSRENGTTMVTQTLTLSLKGLSITDNFEIKNMAYGRPHIFVQDNNGQTWLVGKDFGAEVTTADSATGAAMGDAYAYTITLVATEKTYANGVTDSTLQLPLGDITGATIVSGSNTQSDPYQ